MQILSIHLKNIKSHRDTTLHFSAGINVLSGPNGVGKSTIFEATGYALFGVDARDFVSRMDRFLTIGEKRGEISIVFALNDDDIFKATRTVGGGAKWLLAKKTGDDFEVEEHANAQETEDRIAELLGLNNGRPLKDQFKQIIGPFQTDFLGPFVIKSMTDRQKTFDVILGIDSWRKTFEGTAKLQSTLCHRAENLKTEIDSKKEQLVILPEKKSELATCKKGQKTRQGLLAKETAELNELEKQLAAMDEQKKAIDAINIEVKRLEERIASGKDKISTQKARVEEARKGQQILTQTQEGKEAFDRAEAQLKNLRLREKERQQVEKSVFLAEKEKSRLNQAIKHEEREIRDTGRQIDKELAQLFQAEKELKPDSKVQTLARQLPELRRNLDNKKSEQARLLGQKGNLKEGQEKLAEGVCPFFQEKCQNLADKPPQNVFSTRLDDLEQEIQRLNADIENSAKNVQEAEKANEKISTAAGQLQELEKQKSALKKRHQKNATRQNTLDKLKSQLAEASENLTNQQNQLQTFSGLDEEITLAEKERMQHQKDRDSYHAYLPIAEDLANRQETLQRYQKLLQQITEEWHVKGQDLKNRKAAYSEQQHQKTQQEKDRLLAVVATLRQELKDLAKNIIRIEGEIEGLKKIQAEIQSRQEDIKALRKKEDLVKFLRNQVFKNVSGRLSERFREEISRQADSIYRTIAESDEELNWGENYQIILRDMQEGQIRERTDDQLSGGQMMSAVVALRLALLQTIGGRIAFFDEPTSNLDANRRENLAQAFRAIDIGKEEVTEHWYDQLFLISHDVAFTEITDQIVELEKQN